MGPLTRLLTAGCSLGLATGCFFEGTIAYHPRVEVPNLNDKGGFSASVNIGIYIDVEIPTRVISAVGAGVGLFNAYGIKQFGMDSSTGGSGFTLKGDVGIGPQPLSRYIQHSFAVNYHLLSDVGGGGGTGDVRGKVWFFGTGLDHRWRVKAWNGKMKSWLFRLNVGVERFTAGDLSSTGVAARFMTVPAFAGRYRKGPYEDINTSNPAGGPGPSCPGGYYKETCTGGYCTTRWTCP